MDLDFVSVHKHAKKELGQYPVILTEQTWSIKDLLHDFFRALKKKPVACTINRRTLNHFIGLKIND